MLILPTEAPDTGLTRRLEDGHLDRFPANLPLASLTLSRGNGQQSAVVNCLYESVPEGVERGAQGPNVLGNRYVLLRFGNHRAVVENRASLNGRRTVVDRDYGIDEIAVVVAMPDPQLRELAGSAAHRALMALGARARVVNRTQ